MTGILASGALLVHHASQLWFLGDDWDFLLRRGTMPGLDRGLLAAHNEHWSTIPILIYRAIFAVVGLRHYLPYALPVIAAHLGVVALIYLLLVRFGTLRWLAVVVSMFVAFLGAGAENTLWDFQVGFVGAVFFGLLALWFYDRRDPLGWRVCFVWGALVLSLMCSGIALAMLAVVFVFAAARRGFRHAVAVVSVPAVVYAGWYLQWGRQSPPPPVSSPGDYLLVPQYVWIGLTNAWDLSSGIPGSAPFILAVLVGAVLVARSTPTRLRQLAWAGLAGAWVQFVLSGFARISFGVEQARAPRYAYIVAVLMAPALALVLQWVAERLTAPQWLSACLVFALLAVMVVNGVRITGTFMEGRRTVATTMRTQLLSTLTVVNQGALVLTTKPDRANNWVPRTDILGRPEVAAAFPVEIMGAQSLLDAAARISVGVGVERLPIPDAGAAVLRRGSVGSPVAAGGCRSYQSRAPGLVSIPPTRTGSQIRVTGRSSAVTTRLRRGSKQSAPVGWTVQPGVPFFVGTSAPNASLLLTLNQAGRLSICTHG